MTKTIFIWGKLNEYSDSCQRVSNPEVAQFLPPGFRIRKREIIIKIFLTFTVHINYCYFVPLQTRTNVNSYHCKLVSLPTITLMTGHIVR